MHISEGILSPEVLGIESGLAVAGIAIGVKRMSHDEIPRVAMLAATFFVASTIHIPIGPSSAHLLLSGLMGILLGWGVFPAMLVGLGLQALFFGFGGITVLGVNTLLMGLPGLLCYYTFRLWRKEHTTRGWFLVGFCAGGVGVALPCLFAAATLYASGKEFLPAIYMLTGAHLPVLCIEAVITGFILSFLHKTNVLKVN